MKTKLISTCHSRPPTLATTLRAVLIANGPAFRAGVKLPAFDNVSVAPLLRDLLGLPLDEGLDGTAAPFDSARRR